MHPLYALVVVLYFQKWLKSSQIHAESELKLSQTLVEAEPNLSQTTQNTSQNLAEQTHTNTNNIIVLLIKIVPLFNSTTSSYSFPAGIKGFLFLLLNHLPTCTN